MDEETKAEIDAMSYTEMLRLWRNAPTGHRMFQEGTYEYFTERMQVRKAEVGHEGAVRASKLIGW